jgi:hypothetical protein
MGSRQRKAERPMIYEPYIRQFFLPSLALYLLHNPHLPRRFLQSSTTNIISPSISVMNGAKIGCRPASTPTRIRSWYYEPAPRRKRFCRGQR